MTPVPGGVGPMTVITLIENLIFATEKQIKG
jgi:5,10-methylene-tetrahydrofolate dehydrogenase/methenyl tetrahydrofolate cyclohydrolase